MITNLFGTDGIRKTVGHSPFTLKELPLLGFAIGAWLLKKYGTHTEILIAHDTRASAPFIKSALKTGLLSHPIVIHDANILPTPAVAHLVQLYETFHCGIVISASHNQYQDNGLKIFDGHGNKLSKKDIDEINTLFCEVQNMQPLYTSFGTEQPASALEKAYISTVCSLFPAHLLSGLTITLDCAFGATHEVAPRIFEQLGARVHALCTKHNGTNINHHCGSEHTQYIQEAVVKSGSDIGFAFDGDGDRVIAITRNGIRKNGDHLIATLLDHPLYKNQLGVVGTDMTNQGLAVYMQQKGKTLARTPVGDVHVMQRMVNDDLLLGGEQSGHIIMRDIHNNADGIITALRIIEAIQQTDNWDMDSFTPFPQKLINLTIAHKKDLSIPPLATLIANHAAQLDKDSRLLVRYSGTESMVRIMVEDINETRADQVSIALSHALRKELQ